jgi:hypothetical protein
MPTYQTLERRRWRRWMGGDDPHGVGTTGHEGERLGRRARVVGDGRENRRTVVLSERDEISWRRGRRTGEPTGVHRG